MLTGWMEAWLTALADPTGPDDDLPRMRLGAGKLLGLLESAEAHGVLPAVAANLRRVADTGGAERIVRPASARQSARSLLDRSLQQARQKLVAANGRCLMLRRQAEELIAALAQRRIPAVVIKGPLFADRLYPTPGLRTFTDLDVLVARESLAGTEEVMHGLGYSSKPANMKYNTDYGEECFVRPGSADGAVEIHWNLVNSPSLRRGLSVELSDLQLTRPAAPQAGQICLTPASLLLIAAVHGAASHSFDRLQPLCDVCQAARGAAGEIDTDWLTEAAGRTGSSLALTAGLGLAGRVLNEPACGRLLRRLDLPGAGGLWKVLLTPGVVLRAHALIDSPRRSLFRQLLKGRK